MSERAWEVYIGGGGGGRELHLWGMGHGAWCIWADVYLCA